MNTQNFGRISFSLCISFALACSALAQDRPPTREEFEQMRERLDQLEHDLEHSSDPAATDSHSHGGDWARKIPDSLDLDLSVLGSFIGRADNRTVRNDEGEEIDDQFLLREVELDLRASVDEWADGVMVIAFEQEAPGEFHTGVEEGFITVHSLPGWEQPPGGLSLKFGRFRPTVGRTNLLHTHDLPWTTRPPSLRNILGEEGFKRDGIEATFQLPSPSDGVLLEVQASALTGGGLPVGEESSGGNPAVAARLHSFFEIDHGQSVDVGVSLYRGAHDRRGHRSAHILALDAHAQWRPDSRRVHSVALGGEAYYAAVESHAGQRSSTPFGGFVYAEVAPTTRWILGLRFDSHEQLFADSIDSRQVAGSVAYAPSELLRFRATVERTHSDDRDLHGLVTGFLDITFAFGSHPTHLYWMEH